MPDLGSPPPDGRAGRAGTRYFAACAAHDREAIASIVATLRLSSSPVFLERDYAEPRQKSAESIRKAIETLPKFILFWSGDAPAESHLQQHWRAAQAMGKPILVVRLDGTLLPEELGSCRTLDFTALAVESLDEQDDMLSEYALTAETREFWYRLRGDDPTTGPAPEFFEAWIHSAFAVAGVIVALGALKNPSEAWISLAIGFSIGIVFGPLLAHAMARHRARREMDRWLIATIGLYRDPTAARLRQADDRESLSGLEAAAILHEELLA